jgi:hypothetical protein
MKTDPRGQGSIVRASSRRSYSVHTFLATAKISRCLVGALVLTNLLMCGCLRMGEQSTVADVCRMDDGTFVTVEGFLQLPNFLEASTDPKTEVAIYELFLAEQPDGTSASIKTLVSGTRSSMTNHIAELPSDGYTQRDLRIFTASGETVGSSDRVRISGKLQKERVNRAPCILTTEKIERP